MNSPLGIKSKWLVLLIVAVLVSCTPELPSEKKYVGQAFAVAQQKVPDWAKVNNAPWASLPQGVTLDGSFNAQNQHNTGSAIDVKVESYDLVWSEGYYLDTNYVATELKKDLSGKTINPASAWVKFNFRDDQGNLVQTPDWIVAANSFASASFTPPFVPTQQQQGISAEQLNSILVFACNQGAALSSGSVVYTCNGVDGKAVIVRPDGSLEPGSGRGSWMLVSVDSVASTGASTVPPFQPGGLGGTSPSSTSVPPFQPSSLGSTSPTSGTSTSSGTSTTSSVPPFQPSGLGSSTPTTTGTSSTGTSTGTTTSTGTSTGTTGTGTTTTSSAPNLFVPLLTNQPPPCITPNNPPGCV